MNEIGMFLVSEIHAISIHHSPITNHHFEVEKRAFLDKKVNENGMFLVSEIQAKSSIGE